MDTEQIMQLATDINTVCDSAVKIATRPLKKQIEQLQAENAKLKQICKEIQRFFAGIGTVLDADHIRSAYNNSLTKRDIEQVLSWLPVELQKRTSGNKMAEHRGQLPPENGGSP